MRHNFNMKKLMRKIFTDLNQVIEIENLRRQKEGTLTIPKSEVIIFGQISRC